MSSTEEEYGDLEKSSIPRPISKKKKLQTRRACDNCRRKKTRCDGSSMPENHCSNCVGLDCTYLRPLKKRAPTKGYVEVLEVRVEEMQKLMKRLLPDVDLDKELNLIHNGEYKDTAANISLPPCIASRTKLSSLDGPTLHSLATRSPAEIVTSVLGSIGSPPTPLDEDDLAQMGLSDDFQNLSVDSDTQTRFFGSSSGAMLAKTALDIKNEFHGFSSMKPTIFSCRRQEFWCSRPPWEIQSEMQPLANYIFPPEDLITELIELYFSNFNRHLPLLHRPTFTRSMAEGLHHRNDLFAATVLLVCAVASRCSNDSRVFLDDTNLPHSCGWKWFNQVSLFSRDSLLAPPTLYDLQCHCLCAQFLQGSSAPQACWTVIGVGVRLAQDVGAHRRKLVSTKPTAEAELWKRAFWVLVSMDRDCSAALGRPCAIWDDDFDQDFPIECDDEYWEHSDPEQAFKQPPNKPSVISYFVCSLRLSHILAFCLRTVYSLKKSKILLGFFGPNWEQHIVTELDSALNKWVDCIPDHLRWDPHREDPVFFAQSVALYSCYYHLQILIHRPFVPSPNKPSPLPFPSLTICTNAARSCSHIVAIQRQRFPSIVPYTQVEIATFTAGIVLLLNIWGGKRSGLTAVPDKDMTNVHTCMEILRGCEERSPIAGRLWDILYELAHVGELSLPQIRPVTRNKRSWDNDTPIGSASSHSIDTFPNSSSSTIPRTFAGSQRVNSKESLNLTHAQTLHTQDLLEHDQYAMPIYTDELGRSLSDGQTSQLHSTTDHWTRNHNQHVHLNAPHSGYQQQEHRHEDVSTGQMISVYPMDTSFYNSPSATPYPSTSMASTSSQYGRPGGMHGYTPTTSTMDYHPRPQHQPPFSQMSSSQMMIDETTLAMWSSAPAGFELEDWGTYLTNFSELTHPT